MSLADHPFEPHSNHRYPLACGRCGRIREVHPVVEVDPERDRGFEWACTEAACAGVIDPQALNAFADQRAGLGVIEAFLTRDFAMDGMEEGADWRNYLVWRVQQLDALLERNEIGEEEYGQKRRAALMALAQVAVAFEFTRQAR